MTEATVTGTGGEVGFPDDFLNSYIKRRTESTIPGCLGEMTVFFPLILLHAKLLQEELDVMMELQEECQVYVPCSHEAK
jgi:hypothetical protein